MSKREIGAAAFQATCLKLIDEIDRGGEAVTITKRGRPVAILKPIDQERPTKSVIGMLAGSVSGYGDPFSPAVDPDDWSAARDGEAF